jgi:hypothetical protein
MRAELQLALLTPFELACPFAQALKLSSSANAVLESVNTTLKVISPFLIVFIIFSCLPNKLIWFVFETYDAIILPNCGRVPEHEFRQSEC